MTTPTRRISFYLKPAAVKNEGEACAWLDILTPEARKSGQRVAFLAGLALLKIWRGPGGVILTVIYIVFGNLPFLLIQRYNRPRLLRLAEKETKKNL